MEWMGMRIPCMLEHTKEVRLGKDFTLRAQIKCDVMGGKQSIFSKRVPVSSGNRPGVVLLLHGSCIELMTFGDGDRAWITARTYTNRQAKAMRQAPVIEVGQVYEVLAFRQGNEARIYVNGFDRTNPKFDKVSAGDIDCDMFAFAGMQLYDRPDLQREVFQGIIFMVGMYESACWSGASKIKYLRNPGVMGLTEFTERFPEKMEILQGQRQS